MVARTESASRWQRALDRALTANLAYIEILGGDGTYAVSSQRDCERGYIATTHACGCAAGQDGDPVCAHRALVRALTGQLPLDPEPATSGVQSLDSAGTIDCADCKGCGIHYDRELEKRGLLYPTCGGCGGTGRQRVNATATPAIAA